MIIIIIIMTLLHAYVGLFDISLPCASRLSLCLWAVFDGPFNLLLRFIMRDEQGDFVDVKEDGEKAMALLSAALNLIMSAGPLQPTSSCLFGLTPNIYA